MMKTRNLFAIPVFALMAMTGCSDDNAAGAATEEQMRAVSGHWYAEIPMSGETANWRTEEEDDVTTFNKVTAIFQLSGEIFPEGWWGYIYQQDDEMVNYGGIDLSIESNMFKFSMTSDGYITPSSYLQDAPIVTNMHFDEGKDIITADVEYKDQVFSLTFIRPDNEAWTRLNEYFFILLEAGIVGGYDDGQIGTDVTDEIADEPSRIPRR